MTLYGLKNCDTCRKAAKALGVPVTDIRENPLSDADLKRFWAEFGDALLNTRSTTWRGLGDAERASDPLELIKTHAAFMKRPVIEAEQGLFLGWKKETQTALGIS